MRAAPRNQSTQFRTYALLPAMAFLAGLFPPSRLKYPPLVCLVGLLWCLSVLGIFTRSVLKPDHKTTVNVYQKAGDKWLRGKNNYKGAGGFVYSPVVAAAFVPLAVMPFPLATLAWGVINAGALIGAVAWWLRTGLHRGITPHLHVWVFLLLLPLSIGNLNIAQINPLVIALLMIGILGCHHGRWLLAALAIAAATSLKIYPLAVGLLLVVAYPKQLGWRLACALALFGALPFLLQKPDYALDQYQCWIATRAADNRFLYEGELACRDLWMIFRLLQIPITQHAYQFLQLLSGAAIAAVVWMGRQRAWPQDRLLVALFSLVSAWMLLLGPATESPTYMILAPAVVLLLVQAFSQPQYSRTMRAWIITAAIFLVLQLILNAFFRIPKTLPYMSIQPIGALLFCGYSIAALRSRYWPIASSSPPLDPVMPRQTV